MNIGQQSVCGFAPSALCPKPARGGTSQTPRCYLPWPKLLGHLGNGDGYLRFTPNTPWTKKQLILFIYADCELLSLSLYATIFIWVCSKPVGDIVAPWMQS